MIIAGGPQVFEDRHHHLSRFDIVANGRLEFDLQAKVEAQRASHDLFKGGDLQACEFRGEPAACVQFADGLKFVKHDRAAPVGSSVQQVVMNHDRLAITGQFHVDLDPLGAALGSFLQGQQGVFRHVSLGTTMGNQGRTDEGGGFGHGGSLGGLGEGNELALATLDIEQQWRGADGESNLGAGHQMLPLGEADDTACSSELAIQQAVAAQILRRLHRGDDACLVECEGFGAQAHQPFACAVAGNAESDGQALPVREHQNVVVQTMHRQQVHGRGANEASDENARGLIVDVSGRADLFDMAFVEDHHALGEGHGLGLIVGNVQNRCTGLLVQAANQQTHFMAQRAVQVAQRLIEQQDWRFADQRTTDGNALALTAGKLAGLALQQSLKTQRAGTFANTLLTLLA
ncbi:Uncharacterized protein ALO80_05922 [Pseudomonas caricapapayae]|nr:Uncharacterized protein ALO80_05922 [Pseudomonas caricapapayae]